MGSGSFFQKLIDPVGAYGAAHPNSFIGKMNNSSAGQSGITKFFNPMSARAGQENAAEFQAPAGTLATGAAAGQTPTLAGANGGYITASRAAANDPRVAASSVIGAPGGMNYLTGTGANAVAPTVTGNAPAPAMQAPMVRAAATQPAAPAWTGAQPTSSVDYAQAAQRASSTQGNGSNMWGGYGY